MDGVLPPAHPNSNQRLKTGLKWWYQNQVMNSVRDKAGGREAVLTSWLCRSLLLWWNPLTQLRLELEDLQTNRERKIKRVRQRIKGSLNGNCEACRQNKILQCEHLHMALPIQVLSSHAIARNMFICDWNWLNALQVSMCSPTHRSSYGHDSWA